MSEEQDNPDVNQAEAEATGPRGGERLAVARREQQISVLEVAKELHLDEPKVRALERNDFEMLGAPVFAKGHLRKYAQLVGVDENDVLADYYQLTRQDTAPPVFIAKRKRVRRELSPGPWIAVIIVILVAVASYWWFAIYSAVENVPDATPEQLPAPQQSIAADEAAQTAPELIASEPDAEFVDTALADGEVRLLLSFTGDCWTEISDATGRRLFFEMGRNGNSVELTGVAPFTVLFGNIDNVDVTVNGTHYPISTNSPGSRTARLTIMNP